MRRNRWLQLAMCACVLGMAWFPTPAASAQAGKVDSKELARHCRELAGASRGVCSVLGCSDGALLLELAQAGGYFVHSQDPEPKAVAAARQIVDRAGLYGKSVVIEQGDLGRLPMANGMVDLILAVDLTNDQLESISTAELLRALRPEGKAILGCRVPSASGQRGLSATQLRAWLDREEVKTATVVKDRFGVWAIVTKPPLEGVDSWSHWEHGPDNNPVSTDTVIKAPYMTQWLGLPLYIAMPAITTSANGRLFIAMGHIAHHKREEQWLNTVLARNAYNGSILWQRKLPDGFMVHRSAFIAADDAFYMINPSGSGCLVLDPETGDEIERISIPELRRSEWKWMAIKDGVLYLLAGERKGPAETTIVRSKQTHWSWGELSRGYYTKRVPWGFGNTMAAIDLDSKKPLWVHREEGAIDSRAMVMGGDHLFYYGPDLHLGCLDAGSGDVVWINDDPQLRELIEEPGRGLGSTPGFRSACFSIYTPNSLFFEGQTRMNMVAVSTRNGRVLWQRRKTTNNPNVIYADDRVYVGVGADGNTLALDPLTGTTLEDLGFKKRSCARLTATPDSFFCRGYPEGLTRYDRKTGKILFNGAFRPACNDGVVPANGMLYVGPWTCDCNLSVMGRVALCSADSFQPNPQAAQKRRLEVGQGDIGRVAPFDVSDQDWPTYRANVSRSSSSATSVSGLLSRLWKYQPRTENRPTAPTAAGGLVFLGSDDGKVRALDAATGELVWSFLTAGPIAQPPTISEGRAYLGSGDGHVYALEAKTGRLLWRFRVAPVDRRIMVYGALCSTWPVNSGVLVQDGVAYAAAGIVDYDGTYVCALDAATGHLKWLNDGSGHLDPALRKGVSAQGTLTIADGRLWMAGGNVISPAAYDLETGEYLSELPGDGSPRTNRGEEVAAFRDRYALLGGRLRYSAVRNVVNPGTFAAYSVKPGKGRGPALPLNSGKIAPAWDNRSVVYVNGINQPPTCCRADELEEFLETGDRGKRPAATWIAKELGDSDTVSLAVAQDAILSVCSTPRFRDLRVNWRLCSIDREGGGLVSQQTLPSETLPGGLLVDRDGRVVVVMLDGTVACYGGSDALEASVESMTDLALRNPSHRDAAVRFLRGALQTTQSAEGRALLFAALDAFGVQVTDEATKNGYIAQWHLIGHVPWGVANNPLDKVMVGEPDIDTSRPCSVEERTLHWREFVTGDSCGKVDLAKIFGPPASVAAYGYTEVVLSEPRELVLWIGSNDGFKCWFNGKEVGRFDGGRTYAADQDRIPVSAKKGVNKILVKVTQMGGAWAFGARLTDPSGRPIDLARSDR